MPHKQGNSGPAENITNEYQKLNFYKTQQENPPHICKPFSSIHSSL